MRHRGQERRLYLGRIVDAGRHPLRQQIEQEGRFAVGRLLDQLDQFGGLLRIERQRRDAERCALGGMLAVGIEHDIDPRRCNGVQFGVIVSLI